MKNSNSNQAYKKNKILIKKSNKMSQTKRSLQIQAKDYGIKAWNKNQQVNLQMKRYIF